MDADRVAQRALDLHDKASMPLAEALTLAINEAAPSPIWPCAKLVIRGGKVAAESHQYAPGLPDGEHDVYPLPVDADACPAGVALPEVPVTLEQVEQLAKTMWKGEPVPDRVLRFGAAVLGLADAARGVQACEGCKPRPLCRDCADEDGTCPRDGLPCDPALRHTCGKYAAGVKVLGPTEQYVSPADAARITWEDRHDTMPNEVWALVAQAVLDAAGVQEVPRG